MVGLPCKNPRNIHFGSAVLLSPFHQTGGVRGTGTAQTSIYKIQETEDNTLQTIEAADEEEYVLLNLDGGCGHADIPANVPYVLSGLDTLNPMLVIGDHIKMIGEYEETIGTCYVFSETDAANVVLQLDSGPSETNLIRESSIIDPNQPSKEVTPIASVHKVLKFRLVTEGKNEAGSKRTTHNL